MAFWGLGGFLRAAVRLLRAQATGSGDVAKAARRHHIPVHDCDRLADLVPLLGADQPRLVLATVDRKVPAALLGLAADGWINTHCGPLPRYAGMDAPFCCLYHKEPACAVTLHRMAADFDSGPILAQRTLPVGERRYFAVVDRLFDLAYAMHAECLKKGTVARASLQA